MYVPKLYRNENAEEISAFIRKNNFGIVVSNSLQQRLQATHIPFVIIQRESEIYLQTHMSASNVQVNDLSSGREVLIIFNGPHTYISSSWYDHVNVPTWNYIAVHLYGLPRQLGASETQAHLVSLVDQHESGENNPVSIASMGNDFVKKESNGLVAFEIAVKEVFSAFKLSQNRDEKNIHQIIAALENRGDENALAIAHAIKKQRGLLHGS